MKKFIFLFICTLSYAHAQQVTFSRTNSNNLILRANNCDALQQQRAAICEWRKKLEPNFKPASSQKSCIKEGAQKYRLTVSECLPPFVKSMQSKKLYKSGANCWGTALSFKKISNTPRFIWQNEMIYWQNSPICRKLNPNEKLQAGDIINTYGPEYVFQDDQETKGSLFWKALFPNRYTQAPITSGYSGYHNFLHSETYLTSEISFGKNSPNHEDLFEFHQTNEIYGRPREHSKDCQENANLSPWLREYQNPPKQIKGSKCDYFSLAYRCQSFNEYFKQQSLTTEEKQLLDDIESLQKIQDHVFSYIKQYKFSLDANTIEEYVGLADTEADIALDQLKDAPSSKNKEMLLTWKFFTAQGIRKSLELADVIEPTERL